MVRYRAIVAYDGSLYFGFQRQAGSTPTIQGTIEAAIEQVTRQTVTVIGAGRTDTGVHATGQVIAFDADWKHTPRQLWRALNARLPVTVALQSLEVVDAHFHPRFDARSRAYEYTLYVAEVRQPLLNAFAWHLWDRQPLNVTAMQAAAGLLVGVHDFGTFGQPPQGENTVRTVFASEIIEMPAPAFVMQMLRYRIEADAFLYRMVRRIVGALVRVGRGTLSLDEFATAFGAADSTWPNETAPAQGLCLTNVSY